MSLPSAVAGTAGIRPGDHVCWAFDDPSELAAALVTFLDEGRRRDEQLVLVVPQPRDAVDALADLPLRDRMLASGQLQVRATGEVYGAGGAVDPAEQVEVMRAATNDAVARGRTGLRIAAELSGVAADRDCAWDLAAYEAAVNELFDVVPITGLCLYGSSTPRDVFDTVMVAHPVQHRDDRPVLAHVAVRGSRVTLQGELDVSTSDEVLRVVDDVRRRTTGAVVLDLSALDFLDVAGARCVSRAEQAFAADGRVLEVVHASSGAARCLELFGLPTG